jgi:uncharacterized protein
MERPQQLLKSRAPISSYGAGAFQFAGTVHKGALLISPEGIYGWPSAAASADEASLFRFLDENPAGAGDFLLFGAGAKLVFPSPAFRAEIEKRGLGLEIMDTAAACRTYNILIADGRQFVAALLPA